ncbi:MAG: AraC family transcriptional regulator ligand-binding domain-containing protein [Pseudomonadales bacterium]|nr:AraC family transcriptional regulator ligand-binding domain-containing protein [Pseudomonadales bacterium]
MDCPQAPAGRDRRHPHAEKKHVECRRASDQFISAAYVECLVGVLDNTPIPHSIVFPTLVADYIDALQAEDKVSYSTYTEILKHVFCVMSPGQVMLAFGDSLAKSILALLESTVTSSNTLREGIIIAANYLPSQTNMYELVLSEEGKKGRIKIVENIPPDRYSAFTLHALLLSFYYVGQKLFPQNNWSRTGEIFLSSRKPTQFFDGKVPETFTFHFKQPQTEIVFNRRYLNLALTARH